MHLIRYKNWERKMRKLRVRGWMSLSALATAATMMGWGCSGWPGLLAVFGGVQGLAATIGLQLAAEVLQAVLIGVLGPTSLTGPFTVPGV